jgi:hypothetical protein
MTLRDREYVNDEPITDPLIVLDLLYTDRWEYKIDRRLFLPSAYRRLDRPYINVDFSDYRSTYFQVAEGVGEYLLRGYFIEGKKHWGFTDDTELTISDSGRTVIRELYERLGTPYSFEEFPRRLRSERWFAEAAKLRKATERDLFARMAEKEGRMTLEEYAKLTGVEKLVADRRYMCPECAAAVGRPCHRTTDGISHVARRYMWAERELVMGHLLPFVKKRLAAFGSN